MIHTSRGALSSRSALARPGTHPPSTLTLPHAAPHEAPQCSTPLPRRPCEAPECSSLRAFLAAILDWTAELYDDTPALPDDLSLYVPEGQQLLRPTLALRHRAAPSAPAGAARGQAESQPQSAGRKESRINGLPPSPQAESKSPDSESEPPAPPAKRFT